MTHSYAMKIIKDVICMTCRFILIQSYLVITEYSQSETEVTALRGEIVMCVSTSIFFEDRSEVFEICRSEFRRFDFKFDFSDIARDDFRD